MNEITGNSFDEIVSQLRRGAANAELSETVRDVVRAVRHTGKPGMVTLTLKISPAKSGGDNTLEIRDACTKVIPEPNKRATIMFATNDNRLVRDDPEQAELELHRKQREEKESLRSV